MAKENPTNLVKEKQGYSRPVKPRFEPTCLTCRHFKHDYNEALKKMNPPTYTLGNFWTPSNAVCKLWQISHYEID